MSDPNNTNIFLLIKSLSLSEKRYFKIFASRHVIGDENLSIRLFDLIEKEEVYNQKAILKKEKRFKKENIRRLQKYLYDLVLKSLTSFHSNGSVEAIIYSLIQKIQILYNKALYSQCKGVLLKAKSLASDFEKDDCLNDILGWEVRLLNFTVDPKVYEKKMFELIQERKILIQKMATVLEYSEFSIKIIGLYTKFNKVQKEEDIKRVHNEMKNYLSPDIEQGLPFFAATQLYSSRTLYYYIINDLESACNNSIRFLHLYESRPNLAANNPVGYIAAIDYLLETFYRLNKFQEMALLLKKMKRVEKRIPGIKKIDQLEFLIFRTYFKYFFQMNSATGNFNKNIVVIPEVEKSLQLYKTNILDFVVVDFYYSISYTYFGNHEYKKALFWNNKILNESHYTTFQSLAFSSKLYNLILHFELNNLQLIEHIINSMERSLKRIDGDHLLEKIIFSYLKKLSVANTSEEKRNFFIKMLHKIETLEKNSLASEFLIRFNLKAWIKSRIREKAFAEIIKEDQILF